MRKVIFGINMTIDGCVDHAKGSASEVIHKYFTEFICQGGTLAYGRKTYELMVPFWPDLARDQGGEGTMYDFARAFDAVPEIIVFSRTLKSVDHGKTRIVNTDPCEEIRRMKTTSGSSILLGGVDVTSQLIAADLVDEYHIVVQPVIAGAGRRMMEEQIFSQSRPVQLLESADLGAGNIALKYRRVV